MAKKADLEFKDKYTYNEATDSYIVPMSHRVKPYVIHGYKLRAIKKAMSNLLSPSVSAFDIRVKFELSEEDFDGLKKAFDLSRDTFPLTDEELKVDSPEHALQKLLEEKKSQLVQNFEKAEWKETQAAANKWNTFQN